MIDGLDLTDLALFADGFRHSLRSGEAPLARATEEMGRWTKPSCHKRRTATHDVELGGQPIRVLFEELFARWDRIERTGPVAWTRDNRLLGLKSLPISFEDGGPCDAARPAAP